MPNLVRKGSGREKAVTASVRITSPKVVLRWGAIRSGKRKMSPAEVEAYLADKVPVGRLCTPQDVAQTALYLATDDAAFITGQAINITGGLVMH